MHSSVSHSPYPSPLPNLGSRKTLSSSKQKTMGGSGKVNADSVGSLTYQRALDVARNSEGDLDPNISAYLERALTDIWSHIHANPTTYILSKDEFPVLNFYRQRYTDEIHKPLCEKAIQRYWDNAREEPPPSRR